MPAQAGVRLEEFGVTLDFQVGDMAAVLDPLHALELEEFVDDLGAEHLAEQRVGLQRITGFLERLRQGVDAACSDLLQAELVEVLVAGFARIELTVDAVEAGGDDRGGDQVGVAAGVRQAELDAPIRDAQHRRAVVVAVGDKRRGPGRAGQRTTNDQALVGVHRRRGEGA